MRPDQGKCDRRRDWGRLSHLAPTLCLPRPTLPAWKECGGPHLAGQPQRHAVGVAGRVGVLRAKPVPSITPRQRLANISHQPVAQFEVGNTHLGGFFKKPAS